MDVDKTDVCDMISGSSDDDLIAPSQEVESDPIYKKVSESVKSEVNRNNSSSKSDSVIKSSKECWRGTSFNKLHRNTNNDLHPPVVVGPQHSVLFKLPVLSGEVPCPWPPKPVDVWDQHHVRMPHSTSSLYPITSTELRKRWQLVEQSLSSPVHSSDQLLAAILHYNSKYGDRWHFNALHAFFSEALEEEETEYFFTRVMPKVIELALSLPKLLTNGIPLLRRHGTHSISLSQQQISCLLANAFLCTFPRRNTNKKNSEYSTFPDINFNRLFNGDGAEARGRCSSLHEKLKCLINYFRRVTSKVPEGVVTYSRHYVSPNDLPIWSKESSRLPELYVSSEGTIEDQGTGMLEIDFANKFIGGGVLGCGCVQEEIRFVICPELILARLFTEVLDDTEAIIISGCERFSLYRGYADSFEWAGDYEDSTPRDSFGRRRCTVVAIDAFQFGNAKTQYSAANINRELNKAYAGFSWGARRDAGESVATGNWGCGAFRGDASLKSLVQLMAAARSGRSVAYYTFGDTELRDRLADMHAFLTSQQVTVGDLWKLISGYNPIVHRHSLYDHIYKTVTSQSMPTSLPSSSKPQSPHAFKKPRVQESPTFSTFKKFETHLSNGHRLNADEIENELNFTEVAETTEEDGVKPQEAKMLNIQTDKELCLKRLSSSWTNLNESKKDFGSSEKATTSERSELSGQSVGSTNSRLSSFSRKKKISDYFQTVSKS